MDQQPDATSDWDMENLSSGWVTCCGKGVRKGIRYSKWSVPCCLPHLTSDGCCERCRPSRGTTGWMSSSLFPDRSCAKHSGPAAHSSRMGAQVVFPMCPFSREAHFTEVQRSDCLGVLLKASIARPGGTGPGFQPLGRLRQDQNVQGQSRA